MKRPITFVQFDALAMQQLLLAAAAKKHDSVWLIRSRDVRFSLPYPDEEHHVVSAKISGVTAMVEDHNVSPRVEVLEAHNFVLKALRTESVPLKGRTLEVRFTEDDDLCLAITHEAATPAKPKPVLKAKYRMPRLSGGMFEASSMYGGGW